MHRRKRQLDVFCFVFSLLAITFFSHQVDIEGQAELMVTTNGTLAFLAAQ